MATSNFENIVGNTYLLRELAEKDSWCIIKVLSFKFESTNSKTVAADRVLIVRYASLESNECFIEDQSLSQSYDLAALPPPLPSPVSKLSFTLSLHVFPRRAYWARLKPNIKTIILCKISSFLPSCFYVNPLVRYNNFQSFNLVKYYQNLFKIK